MQSTAEIQWSANVFKIVAGEKPRCLVTTSEEHARTDAAWYRRENGYTVSITLDLLCPKCGGSGRVTKRRRMFGDPCKPCKGEGMLGQIFDV